MVAVPVGNVEAVYNLALTKTVNEPVPTDVLICDLKRSTKLSHACGPGLTVTCAPYTSRSSFWPG